MLRETQEDPQKANLPLKMPEDAEIKPQDPDYGVSPKYPGLYPGLVPGSNPGQYDEQTNRGAGVYAVPVHVAGLPLNYLIPLTYHVPMFKSLVILLLR
ncbi:BnaAnng08650D [Brassica napus]|uniref:BnaAnng08650D protein n=1 Tax=Brassica napus TaxID=3708 RepID=A0A078I8F5_BRANA|nr:BnaAnng08650D [Brassica napus]